MRSLFALATLALLVAPAAFAAPGLPASDGLTLACGSSDNDNPCRFSRVIPDTVVPPGGEKRYRGDYIAVGTIVVQSGGSVVFEDARVTFSDTSEGVIVLAGGSLQVLRSVYEEELEGGSDYGIDAQEGSQLAFVSSTLHGGSGMQLATESANVTQSLFTLIPVALRLNDVSLTIAANRFVNNTVAVNQTGGFPTLRDNRFEGGEYCVRDWLSDPTIVFNVFDGCHFGILHERSESTISNNVMDDRSTPPGVGILVLDTMSPIISNNRISHFGTGILVHNARAYIRDNTIEQNVGDGIRVERNSAPMDIARNIVRLNGAAGIRLVDAIDVPITSNHVERNGGPGIVVEGASPNALVADNRVEANGGAGLMAASAGASLLRNVATGNLDGIVVQANDVHVAGGMVSENARDGLLVLAAQRARIEDVAALRNGGDGVQIERSQASLLRVNASANAGDGFRYDPKGPVDLLGQTDLVQARAIGNGGHGLHNILGNATFARGGWWEANGGAGVRNADLASVIDARESYWGHSSGPTHVANPTGRGDQVEGGVLYVPFATAPA